MTPALFQTAEQPAFAPKLFVSFDDPDLLDLLADMSPVELDRLPFGVIEMAADGKVVSYNTYEQQRAALDAADVVGRHFFREVAPCTNNAMIRERFVAAWRAGTELDERLRYTFAFRMRPTKVILRLLARGARGWLLVQAL